MLLLWMVAGVQTIIVTPQRAYATITFSLVGNASLTVS